MKTKFVLHLYVMYFLTDNIIISKYKNKMVVSKNPIFNNVIEYIINKDKRNCFYLNRALFLILHNNGNDSFTSDKNMCKFKH